MKTKMLKKNQNNRILKRDLDDQEEEPEPEPSCLNCRHKIVYFKTNKKEEVGTRIIFLDG